MVRARTLALVMTMVIVMSGTAQGKARQADFNGDGRADLSVCVIIESVAGFSGAGGVAVIYGKDSKGLNAAGDQFWTQDSPGVNGVPGQSEQFGRALAAGDFDGDGYSDLAIGVPSDEINGVLGAGSVNILYGSASGLRSSGDQLWHRDSSGVLGDPEAFAHFGSSLAAGDFDHDGRDDLAIGVGAATVNGITGAGEVHILYGSSHGLTAGGDQVFNQESAGIVDSAEMNDGFGFALVSGDFDGDGRDDLGVSASAETLGAATSAGVVHVLYGTSGGLDTDEAQYFMQGAGGVDDAPETNDRFGFALASGDFDHNGKDDLAIGTWESVGAIAKAGAVHVLYGSSNGLRTDNDDFWTQDSPGISNSAQTNDVFGASLAAGDFDGDGRDDLAIGASGETVNGQTSAGAIHVLYGTSSGLSATGDQFWTQDSSGITNVAETIDLFGSSLTAGDYNKDGRDDLVIGVPSESLYGVLSAGAVHVIYGTSNGLKKNGSQFWHQDVSGIADSIGNSEQFGTTVR